MIASLESLCREVLVDTLEKNEYHHRMINYLCKQLPSNLLEPLLERLLEKAAITDVALTMFLVPTRTRLVINGFSQIKNSVLKQIGYNCYNLVSYSSLLLTTISCVLYICIAWYFLMLLYRPNGN
jgi:hypothetical protein